MREPDQGANAEPYNYGERKQTGNTCERCGRATLFRCRACDLDICGACLTFHEINDCEKKDKVK